MSDFLYNKSDFTDWVHDDFEGVRKYEGDYL